MTDIFLVRDGIINVGYKQSVEKKQLKNTNFYLITSDFKSNCGYIDKKSELIWRLYTTIGQLINKKRYYHFSTLSECVNKLKQLKKDDKVIIIENDEIHKYLKTNE